MRFFLRNTSSLVGFIAVIIFVLLFSFADSQSILQPTKPFPQKLSPTPIVSPIAPTALPTIAVLGQTEGFHPVTKVVDGDTIRVSLSGQPQTVRLIGVNTPETVDPRKEVECFGKEASTFAKQLMEGTFVRLESDPTQGDRDRYNRILRYVYLPNGRMVNQLLITEGYAYEYTYDEPYTHQAAFIQSQTEAREQLKGLWGNGGCGG